MYTAFNLFSYFKSMKKNTSFAHISKLNKPKPLNELAYGHIKKLIINGTMVPGVLYSELDLAKSLGTSRTPVREALLRLSAENLIVFYPRKGMSVRLLSTKEVEDLFEIRQILEETAYSKIAGRLTPQQIQKIENFIQEQERQTKSFAESSEEFHLDMIKLHGNEFIIQTYENLLDFVTILIQKILRQEGRDREAIVEHKKILKCVIAGDTEGVKQAVREHLQNAKETALKGML